MKRNIMAVLLAAVVMFFWGFLFWGGGVGQPFRHMTETQEEAVAAALKANIPADGAYTIPDGDRAYAGDAKAAARQNDGPIATLHVRRGGHPMTPMTMVHGFLHMLVSVIGLAVLLRLTRSSTAGFMGRMKVAALGSFAGVWLADFRQPVWFFEPWSFSCQVFIYDFVGLLLAGAVLAKLMTED